MIQTQVVCSRCRGKGRIIETPCRKCSGSGQVRNTATIGINIPAGIDDGQILSIAGRGNMGMNGGPAGDLQVAVTVRPHPVFERDGFNIWMDLPLSFSQVALGAEVSIPTLDGNVNYTIKEGTQPGDVLTLKGKGFPYLRGRGSGDQLVRVVVEVPKNLSSEQKRILSEFDNSTGDKNYQKRRSFREKIKKAFGGE